MTDRKPSTPQPAASDFVTIKEAARIAPVSAAMLYKLVAARRIPHYRFGAKTVRLLRSDLEDWVRQHRET